MMFKEGDRVIPIDKWYIRYSEYLTKGKIYTVTKRYSKLVVYADNGNAYWSRPEDAFKLLEVNRIGGKLL